MRKIAISSQWLIILAFAVIYLIWGTTYVTILIGLEDFPPFLMATFRFAIAGVLLVGWCLLKGEHFPSMRTIGQNFLIGVVMLAGGQGILFWSEQYIASGYAAILVATIPIWFVIIDKSQWHTYFSNKYIIGGLFIGFLGILLLFKEQIGGSVYADNMGLIATVAVLFGCICWVSGSLYYRYHPTPGSIFSNLGWQIIGGGIFCAGISWTAGEWQDFSLSAVGWEAWSAVLYLAVVSSIIAFVAYYWLLHQMPAAIVGTYAYVNPVVAVLLGWVIADEMLSIYQISGMMVILGSALLINLPKYKALFIRKRARVV